LVVIGTVLVVDAPASACSCSRLTDPEAVEFADVVFAGTLQEVRAPLNADGMSSAVPTRLIFAVDEVYKGDARAWQSVVTSGTGGACGLELPVGQRSLVFATSEPGREQLDPGEEGELHSYLCSGSRSLADGEPVPAAVAGGWPPLPGSSPVGQFDGSASASRPWLPVAAGALLAGLAGSFIVLRRRRRTRPAVT
jgi:hypothetical protein